jgi:sterol desaturase/sphingolipid hydroxylase (fatty acid hydroxylase superfamily)
MKIIELINWSEVQFQLVLFFFGYGYYKFMLCMLCNTAIENFEKRNKDKIKNKNKYFVFQVFQSTITTLIIPLVYFISMLLNEISSFGISITITIAIVTFLFALKRSYLLLDNLKK